MTKPLLLVVDDEQGMAEFISELAEDVGFDVKIETSAKKFQDTYIATNPTGIVMDIVMPEMDGNELVQWLGQQDSSTPVILMSGYAGQYIQAAEMIGQAGGAIIIGSLAKPIRADDLEPLLKEILSTVE